MEQSYSHTPTQHDHTPKQHDHTNHQYNPQSSPQCNLLSSPQCSLPSPLPSPQYNHNPPNPPTQCNGSTSATSEDMMETETSAGNGSGTCPQCLAGQGVSISLLFCVNTCTKISLGETLSYTPCGGMSRNFPNNSLVLLS